MQSPMHPSLPSTGSWGYMYVTVSLVDNLPPSNFHMCVHMTCNERIKAKSCACTGRAPTVMWLSSTVIPLDQAPAVCRRES